MRVLVIGGTGHVGTYMVPRLVRLGHEVVVMSRGQRGPYLPDPAWEAVERVHVDRTKSEGEGCFRQVVRDAAPDAVIDMLCFTRESAERTVEALRGRVRAHVHCGSIWVHGYSAVVPTTEDQKREPFGDYGVNKNAAESYLLGEAQRHGHPVTCLNPGHIVGQGWAPVGPTACHDPEAFRKLARGEELLLPNLGMETLHHVHADDVAAAFIEAMNQWSRSMGEAFYVVSRGALTLRGYAEAVAGWFGRKARLRFLPLEEWLATLPEGLRSSARAHVEHSSNFSCAKAERLLGWCPRYSSLQAIRESLDWLLERGRASL